MLQGIGIEKGKEFNPSEKQQEILESAAKEALEYLQDTYFDNSPKAQLGNGWTVLTPSTSYQTKFTWVTENGTMALDDRGSSYFAFCTSAEKFNLTNPPTMYLLTGRDADGAAGREERQERRVAKVSVRFRRGEQALEPIGQG